VAKDLWGMEIWISLSRRRENQLIISKPNLDPRIKRQSRLTNPILIAPLNHKISFPHWYLRESTRFHIWMLERKEGSGHQASMVPVGCIWMIWERTKSLAVGNANVNKGPV